MRAVVDELKSRRLQRGWSTLEVGRRLGVSQQTVSAWERLFRHPAWDDMVRWAALFDVTLEVRVLGDPGSEIGKVAELMMNMDAETQRIVAAQVAALASLRRAPS